MRIYTVKKKTQSFLFVVLLCVVGSMSSFTAVTVQDAPIVDSTVVAEAMKYLGTPYRLGGKSIKAFDCSGFTSYVFEKQGIEISRTSREQIKNGDMVDVNDLKPGDLIFFNGRSGVGTKRIGHVGIVVANHGDGNIEFIHSARGGVQTSNLNDDFYYKKRYVAGCRVKPSEEKVKEVMQQSHFAHPVV